MAATFYAAAPPQRMHATIVRVMVDALAAGYAVSFPEK